MTSRRWRLEAWAVRPRDGTFGRGSSSPCNGVTTVPGVPGGSVTPLRVTAVTAVTPLPVLAVMSARAPCDVGGGVPVVIGLVSRGASVRTFGCVDMAGCSVCVVSGAAVQGLSRPVSGGITRVAMTVPSNPNRRRTTLPPGRRWFVKGSRTPSRRLGASVRPLRHGSRAGARVVHVFVATSSKAAVLSARLRRCEPPPSRTVFRSRCVVDVGSNCPSCSRAFAAGPAFHATVPPRCFPGGRRLSTLKVVPPAPAK